MLGTEEKQASNLNLQNTRSDFNSQHFLNVQWVLFGVVFYVKYSIWTKN